MPAPSSVDEFLELVRKSGVADDAKLATYVRQIALRTDVPTEVDKYAGLLVRDGYLTYFQAEQFLQGKWKRFTIGKYKVLERLGSGGMGQVFLCEHKLMRRKVAVKVLPTAKAEDASSLERFYREARAVAALDHPNIVRAYDIDQDDNLHFLVMEYVDGSSFQEIIKKTGPMDYRRACHYIYDSVIGLHHAHEAGLIHRDIKPGNILIDRTGTVKILDMGLARFFNDDEDMLTKKYDENVLGTADYLAPEQAIDSHSVDGRADIYSLGATFYYLLTGRQPFVEGTVAQKLLWHQTRKPKPISEYRQDVPPEVIAIIDKMMAKDRDNRYQTPMELADALAPWAEGDFGPPPEKEMPRLSAAAKAAGMGGMAASSTSMAGRSIGGTPAKPRGEGSSSHHSSMPRGGSSRAIPSADAPRSDASPTTRRPNPVKATDTTDTTRRSGPVPTVKPKPKPVTNEVIAPVWESLDEVDTEPRAQGDTDRRTGKSSRHKPKPVEKPRPPVIAGPEKTSNLPIILALTLGVVIVAGGGYLVYKFVTTPSGNANLDPNAVPVDPDGIKRLYVSKGGKKGQFAFVRDALEKATPGSRVIVLDEEWNEALNVSRSVKQVTIETEAGKKCVWKASATGKILEVSGCERITIRGFTFNGENASSRAISVNGRSPGLELSDLTLENFKDAGIEFTGASGTADAPIVVRNVRILGPNTFPAKSAVIFTSYRTPAPNPVVIGNQNIIFTESRIEGFYTETAVSVGGEAGNIEFSRNRIALARKPGEKPGAKERDIIRTDGIFFRESPNIKPEECVYSNFRIENNTFHAVSGNVIRVKNANILGRSEILAKQSITAKQNYFHDCYIVYLTDGGNVAGLVRGEEENARNSTTKNLPNNPLANKEINVVLPLDVTDDVHFLRMPKGSPLEPYGCLPSAP